MKFKQLLLFFILISRFSTSDSLNLNLNMGIGINRILQTINSPIPTSEDTDWNSFLKDEYKAIIPAEFLPLPTGSFVPMETLASLMPKISAALPDTSIEFLRFGSVEVPASRILSVLSSPTPIPPIFHSNDLLEVNEDNARQDYLGALQKLRNAIWGGGAMFDGPTRCNRGDPRIRSAVLHQYLITFENVELPDIISGQPDSITDLIDNMRGHFQFVKWYLDNHTTDPDEINHYTKFLEDAKQRCERVPGMGDPALPALTFYSLEDPDTCATVWP